MTHNNIHIIISCSHFLVGIMIIAWEVILNIFHVETVFYLQKKVIVPVVKTKKKKKQKKTTYWACQ